MAIDIIFVNSEKVLKFLGPLFAGHHKIHDKMYIRDNNYKNAAKINNCEFKNASQKHTFSILKRRRQCAEFLEKEPKIRFEPVKLR